LVARSKFSAASIGLDAALQIDLGELPGVRTASGERLGTRQLLIVRAAALVVREHIEGLGDGLELELRVGLGLALETIRMALTRELAESSAHLVARRGASHFENCVVILRHRARARSSPRLA
jgi:hypothetical protein